MNRRSLLQAGLLALFGPSHDKGTFHGYVPAEKLPDGWYIVRREDYPPEYDFDALWFTLKAEDSLLAQQIPVGGRVLLLKRPGQKWRVACEYPDREAAPDAPRHGHLE